MNRTLESALRSKYNFRKQCSRKETNELYAQGYSFCKKQKNSIIRKEKRVCLSKQTNKKSFAKKSYAYMQAFFFLAQKKKRKAETQSTLRKCNCKLCNFRKEMPCKTAFVFLIFFFAGKVIRDT